MMEIDALLAIAKDCDVETIRRLIESNPALLNTQSRDGSTVLHAVASSKLNLKVLDYLLQIGANPNVRDNLGRIPADVAQSTIAQQNLRSASRHLSYDDCLKREKIFREPLEREQRQYEEEQRRLEAEQQQLEGEQRKLKDEQRRLETEQYKLENEQRDIKEQQRDLENEQQRLKAEQQQLESKQRQLREEQCELEEEYRSLEEEQRRKDWKRGFTVICKQCAENIGRVLASKSQLQHPESIAKGKHKYPVTSVAISPDSTLTLTGSDDMTVKLWETATGKELLTLEGHEGYIKSVAFSPCGKFALTGSLDNTARIWCLETTEEVMQLEGHKLAVQSVAFSPDGTRILTGSWDCTVKLWDAETGDEIRTHQKHEFYVWTVAFTSCGRFFLSGGHYGFIHFWETDSGRLLHSFDTKKKVNSIHVSYDDKYLIASYDDCQPEIWNLGDGKSSRFPLRHKMPLWSAMFFPFPYSKCLVSCGKDCTVRVWDRSKKSVIHTFTDHTKPVLSAVVSPNGRFLVSGDDAGEVIFRLLPDWEQEERLAYERDKKGEQKDAPELIFVGDLADDGILGFIDLETEGYCGSAPSNAKSATTKKIELAVPERVEIIAIGNNTIWVRWDKVDNASGYEVQYATGSFTNTKPYYKSDTQTVSVPSGTMTELYDLTVNTTYYVRVKSIGSGKYSDSEYSIEKYGKTEKPKNFWTVLQGFTTSLVGLITKPASTAQRSRLTAGLLAFFFGIFGIHDFYLGYKKEGFIKLLLTIPGSLIIIGPVISFALAMRDLDCICNGSMSDVHDRKLTGVFSKKESNVHDKEMKPDWLIMPAVSALFLIVFTGIILLMLNGMNRNPTNQNPPTQNHTPQRTTTQSAVVQNSTPQTEVPPSSIDTEVNVDLPDANEDVDSINDDLAEDDLTEGNQTEIESATTTPPQLSPTDVTAQPSQASQPENEAATASNTSEVKIPTSRIWTSGNFTVEAELIDISQDGKTIKLRRKDNGKVISVPVERLSQEDQDYVAESRTNVEPVPQR